MLLSLLNFSSTLSQKLNGDYYLINPSQKYSILSINLSLSLSVHLYFAGLFFFFTCLQRRHAPSCLWPLTLCQGQESLCHKMSLIVYCTLVPGMMSVSVIVYKIWLLIVLFHFFQLWPSLSVTSQWRHQLFNFYKI